MANRRRFGFLLFGRGRRSILQVGATLLGVAVGRLVGAAVVPVTPAGVLVCVRYVAVDPNHPGTVYAATYDPINWPDIKATVFKSTDAGATWVDVGQSLPHNRMLMGIAVDAGYGSPHGIDFEAIHVSIHIRLAHPFRNTTSGGACRVGSSWVR